MELYFCELVLWDGEYYWGPLVQIEHVWVESSMIHSH